jgi:hypothetical protein
MRRLHQTAFMAIVAALFTISTTHAQAVAITSGTIPDAASVVNVEPATPTTVVPTFDYTLMNWRAGLLSPYVQSNITTSTTAAVTVSASPITNTPVTTTPYAPSALTPVNQTTSAAINTTSLPVNTPATQAVTSRFASSFAPRFVSFTSITNENTITGTINPTLNNNNTTSQYNLNQTMGGAAGLLVSVPEPSTVAMCVCLFVLIGYGYIRRQKQQDKPETTEANAIMQGETNESISV